MPDSRIASAVVAAGPKPCAAATRAAGASASYTANQLASFYAMAPLYRVGALGQGLHVALAEFEPDSAADISAYESCYAVHPAVRYVHVDGGAGTGRGSGEAALDIEDLMSLAPRAAIDVYQEPNGGDTDVLDLYRTIVNGDADQLISASWGMCEPGSDASLLTAEHTLFAEAAAQGQTVFAAAGDSGSTDCLGDSSANGAALSVDDPAGQPYVVGVGGTSRGARSERVWNDSATREGAAGGGLSSAWCMPGYQHRPAVPGLISGYSAKNAECGAAVPYLRQVPDVAADADPATGYLSRYGGRWLAIGGTSGAAPLWAAVAALVDTSPFCRYYGSGRAAFRPASLYAMASAKHSYIYASHAEALRDVGHGNNDYTPSGYKGARYPSGSGYDLASGLGTPLVGGRRGRPGEHVLPGPGRADVLGVPDQAGRRARDPGLAADRPRGTRASGHRHRIRIPAGGRGRPGPGRNGPGSGPLRQHHPVHRRAAANPPEDGQHQDFRGGPDAQPGHGPAATGSWPGRRWPRCPRRRAGPGAEEGHDPRP